jgi:hypothetical protein
MGSSSIPFILMVCDVTETYDRFDCISFAVQLDISASAETLLQVFGFVVELNVRSLTSGAQRVS